MKRIANWVRANAVAVVFGCALGFLLGISFSEPLIHAQLPDKLLSLMTTIAGALAGIAGAYMLWQGQQKHTSRTAAQAIAGIVAPLLNQLDKVTGNDCVDNSDYFQVDFAKLGTQLDTVKNTLQRFDNRWQNLTGAQVVKFMLLESTLVELGAVTEFVARHILNGQLIFEKSKFEAEFARCRARLSEDINELLAA